MAPGEVFFVVRLTGQSTSVPRRVAEVTRKLDRKLRGVEAGCDHELVEDAFGTLIWIVAAVAAIVAIFTLAGTAKSYREIGGAGLARDDLDPARSATADRDAEIRQLLEARNARRERRGEAPLDVEAQLAALTTPAAPLDVEAQLGALTTPAAPAAVDKQLREEIRDHVTARNARRVRAGDEPLDVEAEIERQLRDLT